MFSKRKIQEIFDQDTAKSIKSDEILNPISDDDYVELRRRLRKRNRINDPKYICDYCGTIVRTILLS